MRSQNTWQIFEENEALVFIGKSTRLILLNIDFFTIFPKMLPIFVGVFPNFNVSTEGFLGLTPHKKWSSFWR